MNPWWSPGFQGSGGRCQGMRSAGVGRPAGPWWSWNGASWWGWPVGELGGGRRGDPVDEKNNVKRTSTKNSEELEIHPLPQFCKHAPQLYQPSFVSTFLAFSAQHQFISDPNYCPHNVTIGANRSGVCQQKSGRGFTTSKKLRHLPCGHLCREGTQPDNKNVRENRVGNARKET